MVINLISIRGQQQCAYIITTGGDHQPIYIVCGGIAQHKFKRRPAVHHLVFQHCSIATQQTVDKLHYLKEEAMIIIGLANGKSVSVAIVLLSVVLIVSGSLVTASLQLDWNDNVFVNETLASNALVEYVSTIVCGFQANVVYAYFDQVLQTNVAEQLITLSMSSQCASMLIVR